MHSLTRREFLVRATAALALLGAGRMADWELLRPAVVSAAAAEWPNAAVAAGSRTDSPADILATALDGLGGMGRFVKAGQTVVIKPNATWAFAPHTASSTDPDVLRAVIEQVQRAGAGRILVMDHCSIDPGAAECLRINGIGKLVEEMGVEGIFPDRNNAPKDIWTRIDMPNGKTFTRFGVIKAAVEADVRINMAVAKSHNVTRMTMCLKHMMGFLQAPGTLHTRLAEGIADLNTASPIQAQLHILEAIRVRIPQDNYLVCAGPETDETNPKRVKRMDQVIAGSDPVLIDSYACLNYFGYKPEELGYIPMAYEAGLGEMDVAAATAAGRLKVYTVGQPIEPPGAAASAATPSPSGPTPTTQEAGAVQLTSTPQPTAAAVAQVGEEASVPAGPSPARGYSPVVDPRPVLKWAMLPAAAVIAGLGIALRRVLHKPAKDNQDEPPSGQA